MAAESDGGRRLDTPLCSAPTTLTLVQGTVVWWKRTSIQTEGVRIPAKPLEFPTPIRRTLLQWATVSCLPNSFIPNHVIKRHQGRAVSLQQNGSLQEVRSKV
ncbi:uncharacterized protein LOC144910319 isoform X3 [Branchiostoma floridae x Branchiostoma belcheri]